MICESASFFIISCPFAKHESVDSLRWSFHLSRRSFLQPRHVTIVGRWKDVPQSSRDTLAQWRHGAVVHPLANLSVAVGERQSTRAMMVARWQILVELELLGLVRVAAHIHEKVSQTDGVLALVPEDEGL